MRLEYYVIAKNNKYLYTDPQSHSYWGYYSNLETPISKFLSLKMSQEIVDGTEAVCFRWPRLENIDGAKVMKMVVDIRFEEV